MKSSNVAFKAPRYVNREPELIARVLAGDRLAARELYDAQAPRVFRLVFRMTGDSDLAKELTQEAFVRAFAQLDRFRGESALSTWLHRVTVSVVSNAMRKVKRFRERETDLDDALMLAEPPLGASDSAFIGRAHELLSTTRLLMDSPAADDARIRDLLEDLELVLVQVVRLQSGTPQRQSEMELIRQALDQRDVMPRLRTAVADIAADN